MLLLLLIEFIGLLSALFVFFILLLVVLFGILVELTFVLVGDHVLGSSEFTINTLCGWSLGFINSFTALGKYLVKKLWLNIFSIDGLSLGFFLSILETKSLTSGSISEGQDIFKRLILYYL